jgi:hypothetical protein
VIEEPQKFLSNAPRKADACSFQRVFQLRRLCSATSYDLRIAEVVQWRYCGLLRYYSSNCIEEHRKPMKELSLACMQARYEAGVLTIRLSVLKDASYNNTKGYKPQNKRTDCVIF